MVSNGTPSAAAFSRSIPLSVLLVVPLGTLGSVLGVISRDMPNDVYFTISVVTIVGLSAKDAILVIEFARTLHAEGKSLVESAIEAAMLRLRPVLMTGLAFVFGVVPLVIASGASVKSQQALGTGVMGGMIAVVVLAKICVPTFHVFVQRLLSPAAKPGVSACLASDGASERRDLHDHQT